MGSEMCIRDSDGTNPNILTLAIGTGISDVVDDTTPQLGGDLDVNGNDIVSVSNGAINLIPNGTGVVSIQGSMNPSVSSTGKSVAFGF